MSQDILARPVGYDSTGKRNNCAIVAFSAFSGVDYLTCENLFWAGVQRKGAYSCRKRWSGMTYPSQPFEVAKELNIELVEVPTRRMVLKTFIRKKAEPGVSYLICVTGHMMVLRDGIILDQNGSRYASVTIFHNRMIQRVWIKGDD